MNIWVKLVEWPTLTSRSFNLDMSSSFSLSSCLLKLLNASSYNSKSLYKVSPLKNNWPVTIIQSQYSKLTSWLFPKNSTIYMALHQNVNMNVSSFSSHFLLLQYHENVTCFAGSPINSSILVWIWQNICIILMCAF